jgi:aquaporin Z
VTVGGVSGGAFNPAVAIGAAAMGLISWSVIWVHLLAEILAGALAGIVFLAMNPAERSPSAVAGDIPDVESSQVGLADSATV